MRTVFGSTPMLGHLILRPADMPLPQDLNDVDYVERPPRAASAGQPTVAARQRGAWCEGGARQRLRLGEFLVHRVCQRLPPDIREERYREWVAELPAILHDPQVRLVPRRAVRMLGYAADTLRGTILTAARARPRTARMTALLYLLLVAGLVSLAWNTWTIVQAPGHALNYLRLTWSILLVAFPISMLVRSAARVTALILISATLAGVAVDLWNTAQSPGDWVNYFVAACFFLLLLAWWIASRRARIRRA